jgi:hypothetical protein
LVARGDVTGSSRPFHSRLEERNFAVLCLRSCADSAGCLAWSGHGVSQCTRRPRGRADHSDDFHASTQRQPDDWSSPATQGLSLAVAVVLFVTYILWLIFSLITHRDLFMGTDLSHVASNEPKNSAWPVSKALIVLALTSIFIAVMSEFLQVRWRPPANLSV